MLKSLYTARVICNNCDNTGRFMFFENEKLFSKKCEYCDGDGKVIVYKDFKKFYEKAINLLSQGIEFNQVIKIIIKEHGF